MAWKSTPRVFRDQTGVEWWSVDEAAKRWGVSRRRIYKWINGSVAESRGRYTRKSDGVSVQRKGYTARRRLESGSGYAKIPWGGREVYLIRAGDYPQPNTEPMQRPEGIGQGERRSGISYEANADSFGADGRATTEVGPMEIEARAAVPPAAPPEASPEAMPEAATFGYAQQMVQMAIGRYAHAMRGDPANYTVTDLRNAVRSRVAAEVAEARADRSAAIRERASESEIAELDDVIESTTAVNALTDIFGVLVQSVYGSAHHPWTRDPAEKERVLAAFIEIFRQSGPLDGIGRAPRRARSP